MLLQSSDAGEDNSSGLILSPDHPRSPASEESGADASPPITHLRLVSMDDLENEGKLGPPSRPSDG